MANNFSWIKTPAVQKLINHLTYKGHEFKFVGGCVRNSLLNLPVLDYDIASNLTPAENQAHLLEQGVTVKNLGVQYGSILAIVEDTPFEITSLRKDIHNNGRHPIVEFTADFKEDAQRRDFTINALYLCPKTLEVTDDVGGLDDLHAGIVKFIGNPAARVQEDYLRILRFFRFSAYYSKIPFDRDILEIMKLYANNLANLPTARISGEFYKIVASPNPSATLGALSSYEILNSFIELSATNVANFQNFLNLEDSFGLVNVLYRIAFILDDFQNLHKIIIKKADLRKVQNIILLKTYLTKNKITNWEDFAYLLINYSIEEVYGALLCVASNLTTQHIYSNILHKIMARVEEIFPINGHHLISLGIKNKKNIKILLRHLQIIFWQSPLTSTEEYLQLAKKIITANNY